MTSFVQEANEAQQGCCGGTCCTDKGCCGSCARRHGKKAVVAQWISLPAFLIGVWTGFGTQILGLAAMIILLCTACTHVSKCGLVTAVVFCYIAAAGQVATFATLLAICADEDGYYYSSSSYNYDDDDFVGYYSCFDTPIWASFSMTSFILYAIAGTYAIFIPGKEKVLAGASGNASLPPQHGAPPIQCIRASSPKLNPADTELTTNSSTVHEDISRKSYILAERNKLRQQGVPEHEINQVLPIDEHDV